MQNSATETARQSGSPWLKFLAGLVLVLGLGAGITALFAALGVWFGWWDFRVGFVLLRVGNLSGLWVAIAGIVVVLLLLVKGRRDNLLALAVVGTLVAGSAYVIPQSYRPPEGTPAIHDISTDTDNPPAFVDIVSLRADAPNSHIYGNSDGLTPQKLARLQEEAYPDITTRTFDEPMEEVFARALRAVDELGWDLVARVPEEGRIEATDTTFWFRFKDDVVIRIRENDDRTLVDVRSVSRVGRGDAGKNAERIRSFLNRL